MRTLRSIQRQLEEGGQQERRLEKKLLRVTGEMERQAEHWYKLYQDLKEVVRVEQDLWAYEVMELEEDVVDMKEDCEAEMEEMEGALEEEESRCFWQTEVMAVEGRSLV